MVLAAAALNMLDGISKLHPMLGYHHTRFIAAIFPMPEATITLASLIMNRHFLSTNLGKAIRLSSSMEIHLNF